MGTSNMQVLHRDDLPLGGFAGLREHRLVMDPKVFGHHRHPQAWPGLGNFVYLADARFNPKGETRLHDHQEIDVISIMVAGRIRHEGSLEHGQELNACDVQVQRAGGEGFRHNEVNPDDRPNRMLQLWAVPEQSGLPAGYKTYHPARGVRQISARPLPRAPSSQWPRSRLATGWLRPVRSWPTLPAARVSPAAWP